MIFFYDVFGKRYASSYDDRLELYSSHVDVDPPPALSSLDLRLVCLCVACIYAGSVWSSCNNVIRCWRRKALDEIFFLGAVYRIYYRHYCHPHFHGIHTVMWLVLTSVCCDSNILLFTQNTIVPVSPSAEIRMCVGMHEHYVPGMVCGSCVAIMRSNWLIFFCFLESVWLII